MLDVAAGTRFPKGYLIIRGRYSPNQICSVDETAILEEDEKIPPHAK
jgi:hypothetical protein